MSDRPTNPRPCSAVLSPAGLQRIPDTALPLAPKDKALGLQRGPAAHNYIHQYHQARRRGQPWNFKEERGALPMEQLLGKGRQLACLGSPMPAGRCVTVNQGGKPGSGELFFLRLFHEHLDQLLPCHGSGELLFLLLFQKQLDQLLHGGSVAKK